MMGATRKRHYGRHLLLAAAGGAVLLLGACSANDGHHDEQPAVPVSTVMPVQQTFHAQTAAFGQLESDRRAAIALNLPQAGQVLALDVVAGERVKQGEPLLKLQTSPTARSDYLQARNAVTTARENLVRVVRLHAGKLATDSEVDAARKTLADAEAALAAQAKLGAAQAVETLSAPADGVVTAISVQRGERVPAGAKLLEFAPRVAMTAQLGVQPDAASRIHTGMAASLRPVYALPDAPPLDGRVVLVGDSVDPGTHLVTVLVALTTLPALPMGTAVSALIKTAQFKAWAIPRDALQRDEHGAHVFQVSHGKAQRVDVKVLVPNGSPVAVAGPLDAHAPLITLGSYEVTNGDAVTTASAAGKPAP